jgi:hypothetical protein
MAEVVHVFDAEVLVDGASYTAQVAGRADGRIWEGWIEFVPQGGGDALRTSRETTQPDRAALAYWATGLSATYLEGALARALMPNRPASATTMPEPAFESPAPTPAGDLFATDRAVLDPFSVGAKGETLLRRELGALRAWHLRNIVRAYALADDAADVDCRRRARAQRRRRRVAGGAAVSSPPLRSSAGLPSLRRTCRSPRAWCRCSA